MKRLFIILMALLMVFALAACGKPADNTASPAASNTAKESRTNTAGTENSSTSNTVNTKEGETAKAMVPGTLNYINLKEGDAPVIKGLRLYGNTTGDPETENGFNYKPYAASGIRAIFEMNEWVEVYPETEKADGLFLWVFEHREDQSSYEKLTLSDLADGYVTSLELVKPESKDDPWGSFYLNPADFKDGYYDFVFTSDSKPAATLLTRFYKDAELSGKSDAELEKLQTGLGQLTVK